MTALTKRNLRLFFRDRGNVFFSMLSCIIILALYALFLGDVWAENLSEIPNARAFMDQWMAAGMLAVAPVTASMGALGAMVADRAGKAEKDFLSSPISRVKIAGGYILSALAVGYALSLFTLALSQLYLAAQGWGLMALPTLFEVLGLLALADLSGTSLALFLTSFFRSQNAFSTAGTVAGTLIGFLTGIYLPIGMLPSAAAWAIKLFPPSHAAALLRQCMMQSALSSSLAGAPAALAQELRLTLGVTFEFGGRELSAAGSAAILLGWAALLFGLACLNLAKRKR